MDTVQKLTSNYDLFQYCACLLVSRCLILPLYAITTGAVDVGVSAGSGAGFFSRDANSCGGTRSAAGLLVLQALSYLLPAAMAGTMQHLWHGGGMVLGRGE